MNPRPSDEVRQEEDARDADAAEHARLRTAVEALIEDADLRPKDEVPPTLDELMDHQREYAAEALPARGPDDDLLPMVEVVGEERTILAVTPFNDDDQQRFVLEEFLPALASAGHARAVSFVHHIWGLPSGTEWKEGDPRPSERDDRIEYVEVVGTDGLIEKQSLAVVLRAEGQPPVLLPFGEHESAYPPGSEPSFLQWTTQAVVIGRMSRAARIWISQRPKEWWTFKRREAWSVMDEQVSVAWREKDPDRLNAARSTQAAFSTLYTVDDGSIEPEVTELTTRFDLWDIPVADAYSGKPWEDDPPPTVELLEALVPMIPWREPITVSLTDDDGTLGSWLCCRVCIALKGLVAQDVAAVAFKDAEAHAAHLREVHHVGD